MGFPADLKNYRFRVLSGILLVVFLTATWFLFLKSPQYSEELHLSLQEQLKEMIRKKLYNKNPALASDLTFQKMTTEATPDRNQLQALFTYSFTDEQKINTIVNGSALMHRQKTATRDEPEIWLATQINTRPALFSFQEPILLSAPPSSAVWNQEGSLPESESEKTSPSPPSSGERKDTNPLSSP